MLEAKDGPQRLRAEPRLQFAYVFKLFLAFSLFGFAFLAASFPARNSDIWQHLATGRLINEGLPFGEEPFSYTATGLHWANHSWLFDLTTFKLFYLIGGSGLVFLKAAGISLLSLLLFRQSLRSGSFWLAITTTAIAILAMSPRLLLQPACVSLLFLAITIQLVQMGRQMHFFVPSIIALWVNIDSWFILGPLVVLIHHVDNRSRNAHDKQPLWLIGASLGACLVSPFFLSGLTLPDEISPGVWSCGIVEDPRFSAFFASPWRLSQYGSAGRYSPAGWAYLLLLSTSSLIFIAKPRQLATSCGLLWLIFAILAAWQSRLIPFFAVVVAPIIAQSLGQLLGRSRFSLVGKIISAALLLTLLLLAWPGWLQGIGARDRAVDWSIHIDPTLENDAREIERLRRENRIPTESHVFETHPEVSHYIAWFNPGERTFFDTRLQLFLRVVPDYQKICQSIGVVGDSTSQTPDVSEELSQYKIGLGVLFDPDGRRVESALRSIAKTSNNWLLLNISGAGAFFEPRLPGKSKESGFDAEKLAFEPPTNPRSVSMLEVGPDQLPNLRPWWEFFSRNPRYDSWDASTATTYLMQFEAGSAFQISAGSSATSSPALPILAIRSARSAIIQNPETESAWLSLARAYLLLNRGTFESEFSASLPLLTSLRHCQIAAALHQASLRDPNSIQVHQLLAGLFAERRYFDLALLHRKAQLDLVRNAGAASNEIASDFESRLARLAESVRQLEYQVQDGENRFLVKTFAISGDPLARARIALQLGLVARGQDVLLQSHPDLYGPEGLSLLLRIFIQTGHVEEAHLLLDREEIKRNPSILGTYELPGGVEDGRAWNYRVPAYAWFDICQSAASGSYYRALQQLDLLGQQLRREEVLVKKSFAVQLVEEIGMTASHYSPLSHLYVSNNRLRFSHYLQGPQSPRSQIADFQAMSAILLLEVGDTNGAAVGFAIARDLYPINRNQDSNSSNHEIVVKYQQYLLSQKR